MLALLQQRLGPEVQGALREHWLPPNDCCWTIATDGFSCPIDRGASEC